MATKSSDRVGLAASGTKARSPHGLEQQGLEPQGEISWNLGTAALYEHALAHGEGRLASEGAFVAVTAPHTGCSPNDKFLARDEVTESTVDWGNVNAAIDPPRSRRLRDDMIAHRNAQDRLFVRDARAGADDEYGIGVRVITPSAWQSLFAHKHVPAPARAGSGAHGAGLRTAVPEMKADPARHGTRSDTAIVLSFTDNTVVICGTR